MPPLSEFVVAYDATRNDSVRHVMRRGGQRIARCDVQLHPWGRFRTIDGVPGDREDPAADCLDCLLLRAYDLLEEALRKPLLRVECTAELREELVVALLSAALALEAPAMRAEHFPERIVEQVLSERLARKQAP